MVVYCSTALVDDLLLSNENTTLDGRPAASNMSSTTPHHLIFTEHEPGLLRCVAFGGSPPPDIDLYVDRVDITSSLTLTRSPILSRQRGMRLMYYVTELSTDQFQLTANDDGAQLQCVATVPGSPSNITTSTITVQCKTPHLKLRCG